VLVAAMVMAAGCVSQDYIDTPATRATLKIPTPFPVMSVPDTTEIDTRANTSAEGKYVFLEHHYNITITKISGACRHTQQDGLSSFSFDENNGILTITGFYYQKEHINNSLILFYGRSVSDVRFNSGWFVYSLPRQFSDNVTLDSVTENGTVVLHKNDILIELKPKERWENITREIRSTEALPAGWPGEEKLPDCIEEIVTDQSIYNAGFFDKQGIVIRK
jgi:hypothetical protein